MCPFWIARPKWRISVVHAVGESGATMRCRQMNGMERMRPLAKFVS